MSNEFKLNFNSEIGNNKESILFIHPLGADNSVFDYVISKLKNKVKRDNPISLGAYQVTKGIIRMIENM